MIEVNTVNLKNCGGVGNSNDESHVVNEYISNNIKNEIDIDETPIQELKPYDVDISIVKHEVQDDNFHENESLEEEKEKDDKEEGEEAKQDDDDNDNDFSDHIKNEIEIDEKPIQFTIEDISCNIAVGSVKHIQNEDVNVGVANINCKAENVKNKIDINEGISIKEELEFIKKDFLNEDAVDPLLLKVEADNFHENESLQKEKEKDGKEEGEEAKKEEDDDDDDNDFSDHIKDEIEIDEKPFQFPMKDIPHNIVVGSVKHNIQNEDVNVGVANINCKAENVKNKIDINEGIRVKEELAFVKKEFLNEDAVDPLLPKTEPVEPYGISNSQMDSDEFKHFGHVAVVSLCRLEDLASDVGQSLEAQSSNQDYEPLVEGESSNSSEGRLQLNCLRKYRINRSERGGDAATIQKSKHRNIKAYHCSRCKFTCLTKTRLEDHLQSHGKEKHVCSVCEYMTQDSSLFAIHSKIHERGKPPYKCDICYYKTIEKSKFIIHCRRHTGEKPFTCGICNFKFIVKSSLVAHIAKHTGIKPYECKKCNYKDTTKHSLKLHIERIHSGRQIQKKNFCCSQCDSAFFYRSDLLDHERCIHEGGEEMLYSCKMCKFKCKRMRSLYFHERIHTEKKTLSCDECSFKCSKPSKLNEHKRIHSGEKPYNCNVCQYTAARKAHLKLHIRTHTKEKPYCCDQCDFRAASSCGLSNHKRTHTTGKKRFECEHKKTHSPTGGKPFTCDNCGYKCKTLGNLKTHIRTHTGEKPFKCDICDYKSAQSSSLEKHVRIHHTGEKPFKCVICDYQSSDSSTLKRHVRTHHTGEKPFK